MPHPAGPTTASGATSRASGAAGWWLLPWLVALVVFVAVEVSRASDAKSIAVWFLHSDYDTLITLGLLLAAPCVWRLTMGETPSHGVVGRWLVRSFESLLASPDAAGAPRWRPVVLSLAVALTSLAASAGVGARFDHLPPAYHDEYSYLFQAETFLGGRVSYPSHPAARLFDQMHVLNEGRFASRYFPGAGLWMAPFVAAGHPYWGHWLAGALCSVLTFWIGRELAGDGCGLIAGLVTALSPGMGLFSNLLLAHHPTLVGLSLFVFGFVKLTRTDAPLWGLLSGAGLAFAMLCRPMTAAGVALPFGIFLLISALRKSPPRPAEGCGRRSRRIGIICLGIPLVAAGGGLFAYDKAITGNGWLTPYSLYTELHTPRHVYGFRNGEWGDQHQGPRVIRNYDQWAENLTPRLAIANACTRWIAGWKWTLGLVPLTFSLVAGIVLWKRLPAMAWLVLAGIVSLHAAHIPYWFVGMEDHHYVFEAGPLWAIWVAVTTIVAFRDWRWAGRGAICVWWGAVLAAAAAMNYSICSGVWSAPLEQGIERVLFARVEHGRFLHLVSRRAVPRPALVLVDADPADRHIDYVANSPDLAGPLLIGRYLPEIYPLDEVHRLFPERSVFIYRIRNVFRNGVRVPEENWQRVE